MRSVRQSKPADNTAPAAAQLPPRDEIAAWHLMDETGLVDRLVERAIFTADERARIASRAAQIVRAARANRHKHGGIDAFMAEYGLASDEGIILMCLAEALLRIPDKDTVDALIADKIGSGNWEKHFWRSDSLLVNASTFGLMISGGVVRLGQDKGSGPGAVLKRLVGRSGEPFIRQALRQAMRVLGDSFVLGQHHRGGAGARRAAGGQGLPLLLRHAGRAGARTAADADKYFDRYLAAADAIGRAHPAGRGAMNAEALLARPGLSVKLSALHARFDPGKDERLLRELLPRLVELAAAARRNGLMLTIDAEEQDRLDLTLTLFAAAYSPCGTRGLAGPWACRAGLRQARDSRSALAAEAGAPGGQADPGAAREGRLLGQRDQVGAGAGARGLSGADAQGAHRLVVARRNAPHHGRPASLRAAARHPQRALHRRRRRHRALHAGLRAPAPARHGRGGLRGGGGRREHGRRLPHLRAGRAARGPGGVSGAAPSGERRQHVLHQPAGRRRRAGRGAGTRSDGRHRSRARERGSARGSCRVRPTSSRPSAATAAASRSTSPPCARRC